MIRSMYTAITALGLHQTYMDVVADNLANVNTPGFKASRVMFQDLFSQLVNAGSAPTETTGGVNPVQIGLGLKLGNVTTTHVQGTLNATGNATDLAIQGDGFFIYGDGEGGMTYGREASLQIDSGGYLVNSSTGRRLKGWNADETTGLVDTNWPLEDLQIPLNTSVASETTRMSLGGNLNSNIVAGGADDYYDISVGFFDSLGKEATSTLRFTRQDMGTANVHINTVSGAVTNFILSAWEVESTTGDALSQTGVAAAGPPHLMVAYDQNGQVAATWLENDLTDGNLYDQLTNDHYVSDPAFDNSTDTGSATSMLPVITVTGSGGADDTVFFVDPTNTSMLNMINTISMDTRNGSSPGSVTDIHVSADTGDVYLLYSNGEQDYMGKIAMAKFTNPAGLIRRGNSEYITGINSGPAQIGMADTGGRGTINPGYLEGSNVNMGLEFTNMILAQRGFQANSRVINTADQLLQELVNLNR